MIGRSLRHSLRNLDALLHGGHAAGAADAAVRLRLRRRDRHRHGVRQLRGARDIILLCAGFGAAATAVSVAHDMATAIVDRFRSLPILSSAVLTGHVVGEPAAQLVVDRAGGRRRRSSIGFRPPPAGSSGSARSGVLVLFMLAMSWLAAALGLLGAASRRRAASTFAVTVPAVRQQRLRARRDDAGVAARGRRAPADHPGDRDPARPAASAPRSAPAPGWRSPGSAASRSPRSWRPWRCSNGVPPDRLLVLSREASPGRSAPMMPPSVAGLLLAVHLDPAADPVRVAVGAGRGDGSPASSPRCW